jgi:uncharacterized protein
MAIEVSVIYAQRERQVVCTLRLDDGARVEDAIAASRLLEQFPEIDLTKNRVGIFGRLSSLDGVLQAGDQVEIYRPLRADPKDARRQRAAQRR